jgi:hypothetical protein
MLRAAEERGLPLLFPTLSAAELPDRRVEDVLMGRTQELAQYAQRYSAGELLSGQLRGAQTRFTLLGPVAGTFTGTPAAAVEYLADRLSGAMATPAAAGTSAMEVTVSGIGDLRAYAGTLAYLQSLSDVRSVTVTEVSGDTVRFGVNYRGEAAALGRAATLGGRLGADPAGGEGALRFRWLP